VSASGTVGIGTTAPDNTLHIHKGPAGAVAANANAPLVVENDTSCWISILSPAANERGILFGDPLSGSTAGGVIYNSSATSDGLEFRTGGNNTRLSISSDGIVGIGTTSPYLSTALTVKGVGANSGWLQFQTLAGVDEWHVNYENGGLNFVESGVAANRLFLEPGGNVGIGTSSPAGKLHVNGTAGNNTGVWSNFSDRRLKDHIEPMSAGSLDRLLELKGVTFDYIKAELREGYDGVHRGWIAQQVEKVFPEWVSEAPDGMKMVTPVGFNALAVEALRELRTENDEQFAKLKAENAALRRELQEIKRLLSNLTKNANQP